MLYSSLRAALWAAGLLLALASSPQVWAGDWQVRVDWVPDGDTLFLTTGQGVRIKGIDAPEMGGDKTPDQYFAHESRAGLWSMVQDRELTLEAKSLDQDRHGRILAHVWLPGEKLLSEELLHKGLVFYYPHPEQKEKYAKQLLEAQKQAMNQNRGFWPRILSGAQAREAYVGNKRSKRFHTLDCGFGQRISAQNQVYFSSLRDAFYAGYAPGRKCTPWPVED